VELSSDVPQAKDAVEPELAPDRLTAALDRLVVRDVLSRPQAAAVLAEVTGQTQAGQPQTGQPQASQPQTGQPQTGRLQAGQPHDGRPDGLRRLLGEIAGYLGASFVVGATLLFLGERWGVLGRPGRFAILAAMAVILFGSGLVVRARRDQPGDVRRRLSSTLMTGAAAGAAFAAFAVVNHPANDVPSSTDAPFVAAVTGLVVVVVGYLLARTGLGQLGMAVAALSAYGTLLVLIGTYGGVAFGVGLLVLGTLWAGLVWRRLVAERRFGFAIAVTLGLIGAQTVLADDRPAANILAYALTAVVAGCCFTAYAKMREWVLLAGGVVGATLVVPEALYDVTDGSLGAAGVLLVAGVTLLAGSLIGLRIRRDPGAVPPMS